MLRSSYATTASSATLKRTSSHPVCVENKSWNRVLTQDFPPRRVVIKPGCSRCSPLLCQFCGEAAVRSRLVSKQGCKARGLVLRVAQSTLHVALKHGAKIVGDPTRCSCFPQLGFEAIEISVSGVSDFFAQQLRPCGCRSWTGQRF